MLDIDLDGFKELQAGRAKWSFVREMISNSLDEKVKNCTVTINTKDPDYLITIIDDGEGFKNLKDAYTLFGSTDKRQDPETRGRFNLGDKEFAAVAKSLQIQSTTGTVEFTEDRQRKESNDCTKRGTHVTALVDWTEKEIEEVMNMVQIFQPPRETKLWLQTPDDVKPTLVTNSQLVGKEMEYLETILLEGFVMEKVSRTTDVLIYDLKRKQKYGWLYELGVPIQEIECPYNVDVQQKVPMTPNRASVSDKYLSDIYATVVNCIYEDMETGELAQEWVHQSFKSIWLDDKAVKHMFNLRYPHGAVLESNNLQANERAQAEGYQVLRESELSTREVSKFRGASVLKDAAEQFGATLVTCALIPEGEWTSAMHAFSRLAVWMGHELQDREIKVSYHNNSSITSIAEISSLGDMHVNLSKFNLSPGRLMNYEEIALILHELAHTTQSGHDQIYISELQKISGKLAMTAIKKTNEFLEVVGWTPDNLLDGIDLSPEKLN